MGKYYGGLTYKAVWGRFNHINKCATLIRDTVDVGQNPLDVNVDDTAGAVKVTTASGSKQSSLFPLRHFFQFSSCPCCSVIPTSSVPLLILIAAISKAFPGEKCSASALENRFRRIKSDARLIREALAKGTDPATLNLDGG